MFIPFMGAVISARSLGDNATCGGPGRTRRSDPRGSIGSAACILVWQATGNDIWRALAFTGFFLNLFNLLPVVPLDGGRAMAAMAPWMWFAGFAGLIVLAVVFPNPIILIIVVFGGLGDLPALEAPQAGRQRSSAPTTASASRSIGRWSRRCTCH